MQKEKLLIKASNDYNIWHTIMAYVIFALAFLGIWKLFDIIRMLF